MIFIFACMQQRGAALHIKCCICRFWHEITYLWRWMVCHVFMACKWRNQDVGVRAGARRQVYKRLEITRGLEVSSWSGGIMRGHARWLILPRGVTLKWARRAACVWSCFRRPEANLRLRKWVASVVRHVWGDYMVTLHIAGWLQPLLTCVGGTGNRQRIMVKQCK